MREVKGTGPRHQGNQANIETMKNQSQYNRKRAPQQTLAAPAHSRQCKKDQGKDDSNAGFKKKHQAVAPADEY